MDNKFTDTRIEWLPRIPSSWKIYKVKNCFYISKEKAKIDNPIVLKLARDSIQSKDVTKNEGQMAESYFDYNPVSVGDLLINPMDLYSGANCNVSEIEGVISPAYINLRKKIHLYPKFFDYYFKHQYWTMAMFAHGKGVSFDNRWTINSESILNYEVPFPPLYLQEKIVNVIDQELDKTDRLIKNQQQQIEKLNEYKQSIIKEVVNRGLDPKVEIKDSGFEWIGKIPFKWDIYNIKNLFKTIGSGTTPSSSDENLYKDEINWIQSGDLGPMFLESVAKKVSKSAVSSISTLKIYKCPFVVIAMYGASIGSVSISKIDSCTNQACCVLAEPIEKCNLEYIYYSMQSNKEVLVLYGKGGTQPNISQDTIKRFLVALPPLHEQVKISIYLMKKVNEIDKLVKVKEEKIEKLNEYKKSLIYEYVTGKKEIS